MNKLISYFKEYKQFGFVVLSILLALGLQLSGQHTAANWILGISALINVVPLIWGMVQDLRDGTYGVDVLAATAIISSVLFKEYWAGMVIVLMLTGGESLEDYAEERAKTELTALLNRAPKHAHVLRGNKTLEVKVSQVVVGDRLLIKPGEVIPVDAVIIEGSASIDESSLTGESLPITKKVGDQLLSGSLNADGALTVRALQIAADSQYEQIIKLVKSATNNKSPFVRLADRYSVPFTLLAFTIAIGAWALSGDSLRFLQVLVVATPCPLILGAPIAMISGMSRAAKHGIIVKRGAALEQLAAIKTLGFDKTGTLTVGRPTVTGVVAYGSCKKNEVIALAASLEQNSSHILAKAVVSYTQSKGVKIPKSKRINETPGLGVSGTLQGKQVLVGGLSLMKEHHITLPKNFEKGVTQTSALVASNGVLVGVISFADELRPDTKKTLTALRSYGIKHFLMVTGDNKTTAQAIAKKLGIDKVVPEALPGDKLLALEAVPERPVGFVGDGVNDAPVLASSDVGIALGARGSTAASESADVVILLDNIEQVAVARKISQRTLFIAKQSILTGIILSVILMFIFATGRFKPIYGAGIQELVDVVVIFNALRAHGSFTKPDVISI